MYSSRSWRPVTSGAPSQITSWAFSLLRWERRIGGAVGWVKSAWIWMTSGRGAMGCKSSARIILSGPLIYTLEALGLCHYGKGGGTVFSGIGLGTKTLEQHRDR